MRKRGVGPQPRCSTSCDVLAAVARMPDDWDEVELSWYLAHRAELLAESPSLDRLRRRSYEHAIRSRGL